MACLPSVHASSARLTPPRPSPPSTAGPGVWLDGVESSLLYCPRHELDPATGQALFTLQASRGSARNGCAWAPPLPLPLACLLAGLPISRPQQQRFIAAPLPAFAQVRKAQGQGVRQRPYLLIREDLRRAALAHYARQFRHLPSSRAWLAEVRRAPAGGWAARCMR